MLTAIKKLNLIWSPFNILRLHFKSLFCEDEWRRQFLEIDPEHHGRVTAFFIERRLLQLRRMGLKRSQLADDPIADALLGEIQE